MKLRQAPFSCVLTENIRYYRGKMFRAGFRIITDIEVSATKRREWGFPWQRVHVYADAKALVTEY